jgi:3-hydroxyisobutyrate dehydrogenase-like beta-hydroxyacid dehydrogenase
MATRLLAWPGGLHVFDLREEAMAPLVEGGATAAGSVAELGAACDVVEVMVLDDAQVRSVVGELLATPRAGQVIAVHSTIRPETAEELEATASAVGVEVFDVPVSGGFMGAYEGTLAAIVGGDADAFARVKPVFDCWATLVEHVGPAGQGTRMKLARNMMHFAAYTAAGEASRLAEACDLDIQALARIVRHSDAVTGGPAAIMVRNTTAPMTPDDGLFEIFTHTRTLGEKDLTLALELAAQHGLDLPIATQTLKDFGPSLGL